MRRMRKKLKSESYTAYYVGYQKLENSVSFREQRKLLKKVCNSAGKLLEAFDELANIPEANKKFFEEFARIEKDDIESLAINYQLITPSEKKESSNYLLKELVTDILVAADEAAYDWKWFHKKFGDDLEEDNNKSIEEEKDLEFVYAIYGNEKWVPIRRALLVLRTFWKEHVEEQQSPWALL